jgi:predicted aldo/keto reductase-like oxidoreductase
MIIQTKVRPFADPAEFRATLETSLKNLDVEYIDLFGFHGLNRAEHLEVHAWVLRLVCLNLLVGR